MRIKMEKILGGEKIYEECNKMAPYNLNCGHCISVCVFYL